jgi:predicted nucleic acid-binding protein
MNGNFLIDSNVLIYAYDNSDIKKCETAKRLLEKCWKGEITYAISSQNLAEFFVVVTRKVPHPIDAKQAEHIISDITLFTQWNILSYNEQSILKAIQLSPQSAHFWDALIVATMLESGIFNIYTENVQHFSPFKGIRAVNPFA